MRGVLLASLIPNKASLRLWRRHGTFRSSQKYTLVTKRCSTRQGRGPKSLSLYRHNADRSKACILPTYPQFELMMEIATDGAPIELPEGFIPPGVLKKYVHDYNGFGS